MQSAYITQLGKFLPGDPIPNDELEQYLGQVNGKPSRVKRRILASNGIVQRHYAIDPQTHAPTYSNSQMAAAAVRDLLHHSGLNPRDVDLLACATTWADLLVPGFGSMVHGELPETAPLEATSHMGVCCAGVAALNYAAAQVRVGQRQRAIAVASELPSRLFRHTKFEAEASVQAGQTLPFDTEFLRWMLSDGAGAMLVEPRPSAQGLSLRIDWIELISHANAYPVCMYAGVDNPQQLQSWVDAPSYGEAAAAGQINLRQNIRLLDNVIKLGVEGWLRLIEAGRIHPSEIDWLLCHYSSHFFRGQIVNLLQQADCMVPEDKWFTNLYTRGNTGCASIYLMLEELLASGKLQPGQTVFCFVPESGRFTTAYLKLTVVEGTGQVFLNSGVSSDGAIAPSITASTQATASRQSFVDLSADESVDSLVDVSVKSTANQSKDESTNKSTDESMNNSTGDSVNPVSSALLRQLALVWLEFERSLHSVPIIRRLNRGEFTLDDYQALLCNLRPQVVEGARWIARAASNMTDFRVRSLLIGHAQDEHRDFQMLERNYVAVGGDLAVIQAAEKNLGSEALSAFIFHRASQDNPVDLVGSMFIIEGLGNRLAAQWAGQIQQTLGLSKEQVSFMAYHGEHDHAHIDKLDQLFNAEWMTEAIAQRIVKTAQVTARLYRLQLEEIC
ncbi:MAG: beta-ketoacyl-ACP synthase III [Kaiparowitsia implicata GSE-PSE-MK54-09C]|jgi:3-oxoacyl-[acyl-carrier-protein] synthase-3|nr:beta-ketoacyl-ACP synthase III [Kaiparowitsia implicata GSE-PSE-MK54-09C]